MNLPESTRAFLDERPRSGTSPVSESLALLERFAKRAGIFELGDLTPERVRDFLARWYIEEASAAKSSPRPTGDALSFPAPLDLLDSLKAFFNWAASAAPDLELAPRLKVIAELAETLPRAFEINSALSLWAAERRGTVQFPEFLTSFEEGGHSQYDLDAPGEAGAIEGYFRVLRIEGALIEAEEVISEQKLWPVRIPGALARLIEPGYIINFEVLRSGEGWQVTDCGLAYPPATEM